MDKETDQTFCEALKETNVYLKEIAGTISSAKRGGKYLVWAAGALAVFYPKLQAVIAALPPFPQ